MLISKLPPHVDIVIVGGGPVGALLAQRLYANGHDALLVEAKASIGNDPRALAIAYASQQSLAACQLWADSLAATPITQVHVSQAGTLGRTVLNADELNLPMLGSVVKYQNLAQYALDQLSTGPARLALASKVTRIQRLARFAQLTLATPSGEQKISSRLVILADGGQLLNQLPEIRQTIKSYEQHAVLATLTPKQPHKGIAFERFADDGPLALLPTGNNYTLVWTQTPEQAAARLTLSDTDFIAEVEQRFADRVAGFAAVTGRASWPLALKTVNSVVGQRVVLIGNAAQTLHPVAGQGLNLGLRDASTLADVLAATPARELGEAASLARYAKLRSRDAGLVTIVTDQLITLFDSSSLPLKHARSLGLLAMDQCAWLRRGFAERMVYGAR
ncbi:FAD-dependent monooxygenase [uncultured Deefgea sp.]|uniref:FAD-dependent monooxygenase n=1 Tax=uncultured Deefgea sp. TaxID=1304914 RepID=UPI002601746A|nr:FAD-dependent monooxygenase [uncultured Deefgea sp.]